MVCITPLRVSREIHPRKIMPWFFTMSPKTRMMSSEDRFIFLPSAYRSMSTAISRKNLTRVRMRWNTQMRAMPTSRETSTVTNTLPATFAAICPAVASPWSSTRK